MKKWITNVIDWFLYTLLSEKQKKKLASLFSERQKAWLKNVTKFGKRHQQKKHIKHVKDHLYSLGFTTLALNEMKRIYETTKDTYEKRLIAWELSLWHTNELTKEGAKKALQYLESALDGEKDSDQLRRIAIIQAECYERLDEIENARATLQAQLNENVHPDLYLALANLETSIEKRLTWINEAYAHYQLEPITFSDLTNPTYDDLTMKERAEKVDAKEKVSIILPAYNAEEGIQVAIESILSQTWQNIELIIVDDCSPDNTYEVAQQYAQKDERVCVLKTPKNSGPYVARNIALQAATGDFITVNDADDWSHEKKIEIQVKHLIEHPEIIANTSAHARLTEELKLYRRGTPGRYIFPNMSSIMFRRKEVVDKLGYWDSVRFAADGEFKRRLLRVFGEESFVDLDSGPLSLPRQSVHSLTSSPAFGYNGFFMGARKEYVENIEYYHEKSSDLYYPFPQKMRPFPVPEPMWPEREEKNEGYRHFDFIIAADFRTFLEEDIERLEEQLVLDKRSRIGLMQLYTYDLTASLKLSSDVRKWIDGQRIQMVVYGEKIYTDKLLLIDYNLLMVEQTYIPEIKANEIEVVVCGQTKQLQKVKDKTQRWSKAEPTIIPMNEAIRKEVTKRNEELTSFRLAEKDWVLRDET